MSECRLDRAKLSATNLRFARFTNASLVGVKLQGATIDGVDFSGANLTNADLRNVVGASQQDVQRIEPLTFKSARMLGSLLHDAIIREAIFDGADLSKANLRRALLTQCSLKDVNLDCAILGDTLFVATDLSTVRHPERIEHFAPSSLDHTAIRAARGRLPASFLKQCGLDDIEILMASLYDPELSPDRVISIAYEICDARLTNPLQIHPIFISYSHADTPFVDLLQSRLGAVGIRSWRDGHDMTVGPLIDQIDQAIRLNPVVLLVLSQYSVESDWVEWEASRARELEKVTGRAVLCPVALDDSWKTSHWSPLLLQQIAKYHILDVSGWANAVTFGAQFQKILRGLGLYYSKPAGAVP